jgi:ketol-acid reductoisomerase
VPAPALLDDDADLSVLQGRRVGVIGYGEQGQAQALSLRDSGMQVCVGLRDGSPRRAAAQQEGLAVLAPAQCAAQADVIALLVPDDAHRRIYPHIASSLPAGKALVVASGVTVRFGLLAPPETVDVVMVRPVTSGSRLGASCAP